MKLISELAEEYIKEAFTEEDSFAEKCAAISGFKEGFVKCLEMSSEIRQEHAQRLKNYSDDANRS